MDSSASLTGSGGLLIERTSTKCCLLMPRTAGETAIDEQVDQVQGRERERGREK